MSFASDTFNIQAKGHNSLHLVLHLGDIPVGVEILPVAPVVNLKPGEDWATGDERTRQAREPAEVGREELSN